MAELVVELDGIRQNASAVTAMLASHGLDLVAVTKGCLGDPAVAGAMLDGGARALADTRDTSLRRLRDAHPHAELHRIYLPPVIGDFESGDVCYVSCVEAAGAVAARVGRGERRPIMVVVESGDFREGVTAESLGEVAAAISADPRLELLGLATNYACFQGGPQGLGASVEAVCAAGRRLREQGWPVRRVSAGNSSVLALLRDGTALPPEVTELRCGEAVLLGQDALVYQQLPGCRRDACRLRVPVLERYTKQPARGRSERRVVLGIGHQDLGSGAVRFLDQGLHDLGRSSDYLVVGLDPDGRALSPGDYVEMVPSYSALMAAWTSPFVEVRLV